MNFRDYYFTESKKYDHIDFKPPNGVASEAKKGLEFRQKAGDKGGLSVKQAKKEGVGSGVQRAVNLKNRDTMSPKTVKRMKAFFDRHEKNAKIDSKYKGTPWKDKGYVAWLLWGGDAGRSWANKIVRQMESADKKINEGFEDVEKALERGRNSDPADPDLWEKIKKEADKKYGKKSSAYKSGKYIIKENDLPELVLPIGISGSGKSTWIKEFNKDNKYRVVEPDGIRREVTGDVSDASQDKQVWKIAKQRTINSLRGDQSVILDATNIDPDHRAEFIEGLPECELKAKIFRLDPEEAKKRIKSDIESGKDRSNVPEEIVDKMFDRFQDSISKLEDQGFQIIK